jgi:hypothetical protein
MLLEPKTDCYELNEESLISNIKSIYRETEIEYEVPKKTLLSDESRPAIKTLFVCKRNKSSDTETANCKEW